MGDEYVSVEHLFLAMLKYASRELKQIFREYGISREGFLHALSTVRGNQRVTSDNPEATYDTLNKYGQDLVEKARDQKLDPAYRDFLHEKILVRDLCSPVSGCSYKLFWRCDRLCFFGGTTDHRSDGAYRPAVHGR